MCGLVGFLSPKGYDLTDSSNLLREMTNTLFHRGPDDEGYWVDEKVGIAIGHRRLSIVDLSETGHQPMASLSARYILAFNGEIYNHLELRKQLNLLSWKGHSDTETLLACIENWGLEKTLESIIGMFAIALWDRQEDILTLARDRIGEKPLYYGWQGNTFFFGSELKAFKKHPDFENHIDQYGLQLYIRNGYIPAPYCIFSGIMKLKPGTYIKINKDKANIDNNEPTAYWSLANIITTEKHSRFKGSPEEALIKLEKLLTSSIQQQMLSDVPLGAFLSGGTDSSLVVAIMQSISNSPVKTFTIGFNEDRYNEASHAKLVASHLNTDHTEFFVNVNDAINLIPSLPKIYDEPFADSSQIPTILVSELAKSQVTVCLSGDAGDELFCGYDRYSDVLKTWNKLSKIPYPLRTLLKHTLPNKAIAEGIATRTIDEFYNFTNKQWKGLSILYNEKGYFNNEVPNILTNNKERMMFIDTLKYLPDDILVKIDRAAMSKSLETRVPLLDPRIVEFAWSLPHDIKRHDGVNKWPLKQLLYKYVPEKIVNRPKMGFGVPIDQWLRGPLKDWAENLLSRERLIADGFFNVNIIRTHWEQHLSGKYDRHYGLWTILMFQAWYDKNKI
jgi:asparagine synthase (glutamine-hydrolysing)